MKYLIRLQQSFRTYIFDNNIHRINGPAIEYIDGDTYWFENNQIHRLDGFARIWERKKVYQYWFRGHKYFNKKLFDEARKIGT